MIHLWRLIGTDIFEISVLGGTNDELLDRRRWIEQLTGEPFPAAGICPLVSKGHEGDVDWDWIGQIDQPVWIEHPLIGLRAATVGLDRILDHEAIEREYRIASAKLKRFIRGD